MTNTYGSVLMAILIASSACLASAQSESSVAIITGEIREPTSREITFSYQPLSALGSAEERVVLDSLNRFACELPVIRGALVRAYCDDGRSMFFVEPGDSLHIVVEEGTYTFSGPNADNNRFFVELLPRLRGTRLDYEALKVEDFSRQADQWLQDQLGFLAKEREKYALSSVFIDYATTYFNYGWARLMISYPTEYHRANGHDNSEISPEYYDFLDKIPLVNEKAIGVGNYRVFLGRTLDWGLDKVADKGHQTGWLFPKRYDLAKKKLEGRVLYWFLAGELTRGFKRGGEEFASVQRKWEDFQQINPHPEYTEAVQAVLYEVLKLQPGHPAPAFTLHDLDGQRVSLSQFKGQVVLLDFWASWCGPCIVDLPDLRKIKEKTAALPVVILNLSLDEDEVAWREAIDKHEIEGVHVRADGFGSDVAKSYQVNSLPSYYLVDSQGLIVERLRRMSDTDEIVAMIEKSL